MWIESLCVVCIFSSAFSTVGWTVAPISPEWESVLLLVLHPPELVLTHNNFIRAKRLFCWLHANNALHLPIENAPVQKTATRSLADKTGHFLLRPTFHPRLLCARQREVKNQSRWLSLGCCCTCLEVREVAVPRSWIPFHFSLSFFASPAVCVCVCVCTSAVNGNGTFLPACSAETAYRNGNWSRFYIRTVYSNSVFLHPKNKL